MLKWCEFFSFAGRDEILKAQNNSLLRLTLCIIRILVILEYQQLTGDILYNLKAAAQSTEETDSLQNSRQSLLVICLIED